MNWATIEEFYESDTRRPDSPEVDLGHRWIASSRWPEWRLTWIADTGEIVWVRARGDEGPAVALAGWVGSEAALQKMLKGWQGWQGRPAGVRWVLENIRKHAVPAIRVTEQHRARARKPAAMSADTLF
jgi:hypothetical protein